MSQLSRSGPEGREDLCRAAGLQLPAGLHWHPLKVMLTPVKGCSSNRRGELAVESESKQARSYLPFFYVLLSWLPLGGDAHI